jgi:V8-like Glu-specific endopeptidase
MTKLPCYAVLSALALTVATPAFAVTIRDDRPDSRYLSLGAQYTSVGQFFGSSSGGNYSGSGVLLSPEWVLTAAHVADRSTSALTFNIGGTSYNASAWYVHPNWNGDLNTGYDISLVRLTAPTTAPTAALYAGASELNKTGTYVGFGNTGKGSTGYNLFDGQKRGAQNVVDAYLNSSQRILVSDFDNIAKNHQKKDNITGSASPLDLEGIIAPGDSGGGLFISEGGRNYLAGIVSWLGSRDGRTNADYGDYSGVIRVSSHLSWINSVLDGNSIATDGTVYTGSNGSLTPMVATAAVPEPASLAILGLSAVALLTRRRK